MNGCVSASMSAPVYTATHAGMAARLLDVDATDARVRERAAHEVRMQHARRR